MEKFQNKYRIDSARLKNWNYASEGAFFITICTQNRAHFFGEIRNGIMLLNNLGEFAQNFWMEIPNHFPNVRLGNFVVMPNHIRGVLMIVGGNESVESVESVAIVATLNGKNELMASISPKQGSISTIIRSYKSVVTKNARIIDKNFKWQTRFHDHIIRDGISFVKIQNYIANNPKNWKEDKFF